jgi:hypothetical protein
MSYAMQKRLEHINNKKKNGHSKSHLYNNNMFHKFISQKNSKNIELKNVIQKITEKFNDSNDSYKSIAEGVVNSVIAQISQNTMICEYATKINDIINDLHDITEMSSPIINTPEHPFTKMDIERHLMIGTSIVPDVYESLPTIHISNDNVVTGVWSDKVNICGFIETNINQIYNLVVNNNIYNFQTYNDGTLEVVLYELNYEHINGNVKFVRTMIIDQNKNTMTIIKKWNVMLNC